MPKVDQRRSDDQRVDFLTSAAAAKFLGVKPRTLYAYVSRGLLTRIRDGQRSRYQRADLERLKARHAARAGHGPVAGAALDWGEPVLETRICAVTTAGPRYRGHLAVELIADGAGFGAVCGLLWGGTLAEDPVRAAAAARGARERRPSNRLEADVLPETAPVLRLLDLALARLRADPAPFGLAPERERARAAALVDAFAGAAGPGDPGDALDPATRFLASFGQRPTPRARRLVDAALVACADHELNASTFAARVAASTGSDLHACLAAALATFLGPRHGTASHQVAALLTEIGAPARAAAVVRDRTARGESIPGFGHALYPAGDPRGRVLLDLVARSAPGRAAAGIAALVAATHEIRGEHPNLDCALVAVTRALRLPPAAAPALFAVGRTAGWVAHVLEQRESPRLLRPRARYVG